MPYLIDGHNLIPKLPELDLTIPDDEQQLIEMLQDFCRRRRQQAEVYFDNAPPGQPRARKLGNVTAFFVRSGQTADEAIGARLKRLGAAARNWTVVSSDLQVRAAARAVKAQSVSSETFARQMQELLRPPKDRSSPDDLVELRPDEVEFWLRLFGEDDHSSNQST